MRTKIALYAAVLLVNGLAFLFGETGSAIKQADPVILSFALFGVFHLEWLALRAAVWAAYDGSGIPRCCIALNTSARSQSFSLSRPW